MPLSGDWLNKQKAYRLTEANWQRHANPAHENRGRPDAVAQIDAPPYQDPSTVGDAASDMMPGRGLRVDHTPQNHAYGSDRRTLFPRVDLRDREARYPNPLHGVNQGAVFRTHYQTPTLQFAQDKYCEYLVDGLPRPPVARGVGDTVLRRGWGSYQENYGDNGARPGPERPGRVGRNIAGLKQMYPTGPDPWKPGTFRVSEARHPYGIQPYGISKTRIVKQRVANLPTNAPPPTRPSRYAAQFSSQRRFIKRYFTRPQIRRTPGPFDEPLIAEQPTYVPQVVV